MSELGERLKFLRALTGLKARAFDRKAKVAEGLAAMVEAGVRPVIRAETAKRYAKAHGCDWVWLYDGTGKPPRQKGRAA